MSVKRKTEASDPLRSLDQREDVRYALRGLIPACLKDGEGREIPAVLLDASSRGLGILACDFPKRAGESVLLCIEGQADIHLKVLWTLCPALGESAGLQGLTRVGLTTAPGQVDLVQSFRALDCIDD